MEILFENTYVRDKALSKEICGYQWFHLNFYWPIAAIVCISWISNVVSAALGYPYDAVAFVLAPLWLLWAPLCYVLQVRTMLKRDQECFDGEILVRMTVAEEWIEVQTNGNTIRAELCRMKRAYQTKHLILVRSEARLFYILRKDSFSLGSREEFIAFLMKKGIRVKGK